jgi:nitroreductase
MEPIGLEQGMRERRAVRHYSDAPVADALLAEIFELASWAPSPGNTQAWRLIALGHEASRDVIARFELAGWEQVFPVLEQVLRADAAARPESGASRPATPTEWRRHVVDMYREHFEVRGSPRLLLVYRVADNRRYANLLALALAALLQRAARKPTLAEGLRYLVHSLRKTPRLMRVNALTRTFGLANFTYALTLAAYSRGLATCIQSNYLNVQPELRRYLGLGAEIDIVATVLIGHRAPDASLVPELFRTRKPVSVDWIDETPGAAKPREALETA